MTSAVGRAVTGVPTITTVLMCLAVAVLSRSCLLGESDKSERAIGLLWRSCWAYGLASSSSASLSVTSPGHLSPCTETQEGILAISIVLTSAMVVVVGDVLAR